MKETLNYYRELLFSLENEYNNLSPSDVRSHLHLPDKIEMVKQFIETLESFEIIFDSETKELINNR